MPATVTPLYPNLDGLDRNVAIQRIRTALKQRSGRAWSVKGGTGTAWGWITVSAPPRRLVDGSMTEADRTELGELLGLGKPCHHQGESIPGQTDFRVEYVDRAEGREPRRRGVPQWD